ncbi:MAG TPA: hypothetical protein VHQ65_02860 [Thermoanaerobaculia bacterium]|nr:hypothetical protein [Thermoanaerobaculia bacterium]
MSAPASATLRFPGCAVRVESDDPAVLAELARLWPFACTPAVTPPGAARRAAPIRPARREAAAEPPTFRLVATRGGLAVHRPDVPGTAPSRPLPAAALLPVLERTIQQLLTERVADRLLLHAAAVGLRGGAVLLPAPSGSGKTTLAAALVRGGAAYLTDELTVLAAHDGDERVEPFPKALSLKDGSLPLFPGLPTTAAGAPGERVHHLAPDDLRHGCAACEALPVAAVLLPHYRPDAPHPAAIAPLTAGETFLALFEAAANLPLHKQAGVDRLLALARRYPGARLTFRDLEAAVAAVLAHDG